MHFPLPSGLRIDAPKHVLRISELKSSGTTLREWIVHLSHAVRGNCCHSTLLMPIMCLYSTFLLFMSLLHMRTLYSVVLWNTLDIIREREWRNKITLPCTNKNAKWSQSEHIQRVIVRRDNGSPFALLVISGAEYNRQLKSVSQNKYFCSFITFRDSGYSSGQPIMLSG